MPAGGYSPYVHESIARLGTWLPFEQVPAELAWFTEVACGRETARRVTEAAGAALVAAETAVVVDLEQHWPAPEVPAALHQVSVDGAMVPLVHQAWAEVKTLAIGAVVPGRGRDGAPTVHAQELSYFARLTDADTFRRLAWAETHRRGITLAPQVVAVVDGAEWCQGFVDWHCPDAVRILDWAHAAEYVSAAARSVFGPGSPPLVAWLDQQLHELRHGDPERVLAALRALPAVTVAGPDGPTCPRDEALGYLTKRREQIAYATFAAAGLPIGSGAVESANKLVMEARLKGSGMHWARANVNPMLALRSAACSQRWRAAWAQLRTEQRQAVATRRPARAAASRPADPPTPPPEPSAARPAGTARRAVARLPLGRVRDGRPTADHRWREPFLRRRAPAPIPAKD